MSLIPWRNKQKGAVQAESSPMTALRTEIDRLFDSFMREPWAALGASASAATRATVATIAGRSSRRGVRCRGWFTIRA